MSTTEIFIEVLEGRIVKLTKSARNLIQAIEQGGDIEKAKNDLKILLGCNTIKPTKE